MLPIWHIIWGFVFAVFAINIFELSDMAFLLIFLSSVLIDVDHYLYYVYKRKKISPIKAFKEFIRINKSVEKIPTEFRPYYRSALCFFHSIELIIILYLLSMFEPLRFFLFIATGLSFHLLLDIIHALYTHTSIKQLLGYYTIFGMIQSKKNKKSLWDLGF